MKKASLRDLHIRTSELVREAEEGSVIVIERRGEPVAELRPISRKTKKIKMPDMSRFWNEFPQVPGDSTQFISEDRDRLMYLDSAYIAKFYLNEPDSPRVRAAFAEGSSLVSSVWALGEVSCALHRHLRERSIDTSQFHALANTFMQHVDAGLWTLVPVTERLLRKMIALMTALPASVHLRSGDALHLATALDLGEREIWSSDRHVLAGAPYFGLTGRTA